MIDKNILQQFVSTMGYKKNSPDRNSPFNIIPSGNITMKEDDGSPLSHPVMAVQPDGSQTLMQPGKDYNFGKGPILEIPIKQDGGSITLLTEEEEKAFQNFYKTLPENLQSDDPTYDIRGYWDSENRPESFDYNRPVEDDGYYHAYSINQNTGEYLKSPAHPTFQHAVDEDRKIGYRPITNVKGRNIAFYNPEIIEEPKPSILENTTGPTNFQNGGNIFPDGKPLNISGPTAEEQPVNTDAMNAMMKARMAIENEFGNPSAQRMVSPNPKTYDFGNGYTGTHFMSSAGRYAVPQLQDKGGEELTFFENLPPRSSEDIKFNTEEEAQYFSEHYKEVAPMMKGFEKGGTIGLKDEHYDKIFSILSKKDSLPKAQDGGDTIYEFKGRPGSTYKNVQGKWLIQNADTNGKYVLIQDPTGKRTAVLNKQAVPANSITPEQQKGWNELGNLLEKPVIKIPTNMREAQQMMDNGELAYESWDEKKAKNDAEAAQRKQAREKSLSDYEARTQRSDYNTWTGLPDESFREMLAKEAESLDAKFRISQEDNFFDDYLNPAVWVGSMAKALGEAPQKAKETNSYMPYITSIGMPLTVGALAGLGAANTSQFINNAINPLAGIVKTPNVVKKALGTETGLLSNAYKINPLAKKLNNPEMGYRSIGVEGYEDAINTSQLRAKPLPISPSDNTISLVRNTNRNPNTGKMQGHLDRPYFADGFHDSRYGRDYVAEVNKADNNLVEKFTHKGIAPLDAGFVPMSEATIYKKHWLKGFEEASNPYKGIRSVDDINTSNFSDYLLGQKLAGNKGAFNQGIYELKQFPDNVIKFENPDMISRRSGLPEYMDYNAAEATKYLPENQGFAKVYNQLNFDDYKRGLIMPKLQGKSFEDMSRKEFLKWVDNPETMQDLIQKQKILRDQGLSFDFFGNGNMSVRPDGKVNVFDFEPFSKKRITGDWWDLNVQGQTNPYLYEASQLGKNHKSVLEKKLLDVYTEKMSNIEQRLLKSKQYRNQYNINKPRVEDKKTQEMSKILESLDNQAFKKGGTFKNK